MDNETLRVLVTPLVAFGFALVVDKLRARRGRKRQEKADQSVLRLRINNSISSDRDSGAK